MSAFEAKRLEEFHLLPLLTEQFPDMADSYRNNLNALMKKADLCSSLQWYKDNSSPVFFRFDIKLPAFFLVSEPLSRFQAYKQYIMPTNDEHKFYASLGIIPVYFANLNRVSCVKLWGDQATGFFAPYSQPLRQQNESIWQFGVGIDNPAKFSSLNFVLRNGATERQVPDSIRTAILGYFQYAFWSFPKKGFGSSAHIIHSRENINHILKVTKGIYILRYIHEARQERLGPYYWGWAQRVELEAFNLHGESITLSVYMAKDVVQQIWREIDEEKNSELIINGLIYDFRGKNHDANEKLRLLSVTAGFMPNDIELLKTLIGFSAAEKFHFNKETLGRICTIDQLKNDISHKYIPYSRITDHCTSFLGSVDLSIEYLLDELYPMVVQEGQEVFFVHPVILSALSALGEYNFIIDKNKIILINLIHLLEKLKVAKEFQSLRFTEEAEYFKGIGVDFSSLCSVLLLALKTIVLSKLLNEFF